MKVDTVKQLGDYTDYISEALPIRYSSYYEKLRCAVFQLMSREEAG